MNDYRVIYLPPDTPVSIKGCAVKCVDDFTILINPNLSHDAQREVYEHERAHIEADHFYNGSTIEEKEAEAEKRRFERLNLANG